MPPGENLRIKLKWSVLLSQLKCVETTWGLGKRLKIKMQSSLLFSRRGAFSGLEDNTPASSCSDIRDLWSRLISAHLFFSCGLRATHAHIHGLNVALLFIQLILCHGGRRWGHFSRWSAKTAGRWEHRGDEINLFHRNKKRWLTALHADIDDGVAESHVACRAQICNLLTRFIKKTRRKATWLI